ncbi:MAG TPA: twin-arginine translocase subunit TatC [Solirubrobacteraceae bacterium]|nr:twin-arginine translocase subunit TatC [Solirubrobacteraceae bacterium]
MGTVLRPIGHEDRLSLVDHLSELRKRLIISIVTLLACFSVCFWQNNAILDVVTKPVRDAHSSDKASATSKDPDQQAAFFVQQQVRAYRTLAPALSASARTFDALAAADNVTATQRAAIAASSRALAAAGRQAAAAARAAPRSSQSTLVTLGVTEPFTATITIAFYSALLLAMPMLLYQAYAFILPAFSPRERKVALPLMLMVPALFVAGVAFGYFVVLDRAVNFLQNFNADSFNNLLQANTYFKFAVLFVAGIGLLFQIPVGVLAVTRLGIFTPKQLAKNRGYVILAISIFAAVATPTPDPVTMTLAMAPLIVLFELSILLARWIDRIKPAVDDADDEEGADDAYDGAPDAEADVSADHPDPPKLQDPEPKD